MAENLINYSALAYLNQWYVTDRRFMEILTSTELGKTAGARLQLLAAKYQGSRNFADPGTTKSEKADRASGLWLKVADCVVSAAAAPRSNVDETVTDLADKLGKIFPGKANGADPTLLSAATKFLWFSGRDDIRIYDRRAIRALNSWCKANRRPDRRGWRVDDSYPVFAEEWGRMYKAHEAAIRGAIIRLEDAFHWSLLPQGEIRHAARAVMTQQWFVDRVFDKHLWTIGADDETRVGGFV